MINSIHKMPHGLPARAAGEHPALPAVDQLSEHELIAAEAIAIAVTRVRPHRRKWRSKIERVAQALIWMTRDGAGEVAISALSMFARSDQPNDWTAVANDKGDLRWSGPNGIAPEKRDRVADLCGLFCLRVGWSDPVAPADFAARSDRVIAQMLAEGWSTVEIKRRVKPINRKRVATVKAKMRGGSIALTVPLFPLFAVEERYQEPVHSAKGQIGVKGEARRHSRYREAAELLTIARETGDADATAEWLITRYVDDQPFDDQPVSNRRPAGQSKAVEVEEPVEVEPAPITSARQVITPDDIEDDPPPTPAKRPPVAPLDRDRITGLDMREAHDLMRLQHLSVYQRERAVDLCRRMRLIGQPANEVERNAIILRDAFAAHVEEASNNGSN